MRKLLSGNEAIARGAYESGVRVASAYPGTPSTEILETIASEFPEIYAEWAPNEKVALEVGIGCSFAGGRALVAMKHVGVNVASDPLFTLSYTGVRGGLVLTNADDPGMHSSQNEQDSRNYARFAKIPMLAPSDSQEAKDFVIQAFEISEQFDTPVMLLSMTRISHSKSLVDIRVGSPTARTRIRRRRDDRAFRWEIAPPSGFIKEPKKFVMIPAHGRMRHAIVEQRLEKLRVYSNESPLQKMEMRDAEKAGERGGEGAREDKEPSISEFLAVGDPTFVSPRTRRNEIGIITSGISYQYSREVVPEASILKLGMVYPLPERLIREFASRVKKLYVVEELDPFFEEQIRQMGLDVQGVGVRLGELSPDVLMEFFHGEEGRGDAGTRGHRDTETRGHGDALGSPTARKNKEDVQLPGRPPAMCAGCPHRSVFYMLKKKKLVVTGDIGCYTLSVLPPLEAMDTCVCMGASIGNAMGIEKATGRSDNVVAVIGDSTFVHSGITGLVDMVYNKSKGTVIILDNDTTAMTGRQEHPGTGYTLMGEETKRLDFLNLAKALGVEYVMEVDPYDLDALDSVIDEAVNLDKLAVIITNQPCVLLGRERESRIAEVDLDACTGCQLCMQLGCPAISSVSPDVGSPTSRKKKESDVGSPTSRKKKESDVGSPNGANTRFAPTRKEKDDDKRVEIDPTLCSGCMVCAEICRSDAIKELAV